MSDWILTPQKNEPSSDWQLSNQPAEQIDESVKKLIVGSNPLEQIKSGLLGMGIGAENVATTLTGGRAPRVMEDVSKMVGGNNAPIASATGQYAPLIAAAPEGLLAQMLSGGAYQATQSPENPLLGAVEGAILPPGLKMLSKGLGALKNVATGAFKNLTPYEEAAQKAGLEHEAASQTEKEAKGLQPGKIAYENPKNDYENIENQIGRELNTEAAHNIRVTDSLRARIPQIYQYWGDRYKNFVGKLAANNFQMPEKILEEMPKQELDMNEINQRLQKGLGTGNKRLTLKYIEPEVTITENESPYFRDLMSRAPTALDTDAATFLSKYKDFRNGLYEMRQVAKTTDDEGLRRQMFKDLNKAHDMQTTIKDVLEKGLGEHAPEFKEINNGYETQVYP